MPLLKLLATAVSFFLGIVGTKTHGAEDAKAPYPVRIATNGEAAFLWLTSDIASEDGDTWALYHVAPSIQFEIGRGEIRRLAIGVAEKIELKKASVKLPCNFIFQIKGKDGGVKGSLAIEVVPPSSSTGGFESLEKVVFTLVGFVGGLFSTLFSVFIEGYREHRRHKREVIENFDQSLLDILSMCAGVEDVGDEEANRLRSALNALRRLNIHGEQKEIGLRLIAILTKFHMSTDANSKSDCRVEYMKIRDSILEH